MHLALDCEALREEVLHGQFKTSACRQYRHCTRPEVSQDVARELRSRSVDFLDAPVTGGPVRAASGTLTSMVGGDEASFKRATPILQSFSSKVLYMGTTGNGQLAKALNNCLYNVSVAAMAEMLPLASRAGLSLESFVEVVWVALVVGWMVRGVREGCVGFVLVCGVRGACECGECCESCVCVV